MNAQRISKAISILDLCAKAFNYPNEDIPESMRYLGELVGNEELENFSLSLELLESEYIQLFSINSSSNKTVPNASWWIDGKMMGKTFIKINVFYKESGFIVDLQNVNLPQDHISLMCSFVAILLEQKEYERALIFMNKYLNWLDKFEISLNEASSLGLYSKIVLILKDELDFFKELSKRR